MEPEYDPETKRQLVQWKSTYSPRPRKARISKSKIKTMLIIFFNDKGNVITDYYLSSQPESEVLY
jgi:hypothetical protein